MEELHCISDSDFERLGRRWEAFLFRRILRRTLFYVPALLLSQSFVAQTLGVQELLSTFLFAIILVSGEAMFGLDDLKKFCGKVDGE